MIQPKYCNHKMFLVMLTSKYYSITAMLLVSTYVAKTSFGQLLCTTFAVDLMLNGIYASMLVHL